MMSTTTSHDTHKNALLTFIIHHPFASTMRVDDHGVSTDVGMCLSMKCNPSTPFVVRNQSRSLGWSWYEFLREPVLQCCRYKMWQYGQWAVDRVDMSGQWAVWYLYYDLRHTIILLLPVVV
jgi:hypothetical protein